MGGCAPGLIAPLQSRPMAAQGSSTISSPSPALRKRVDAYFKDRHVCITGGAGFIGSHLVDALVDCGARVTVLDDLSFGHLDNLAAHLDAASPRVRLIKASILDEAGLREAVSGCDVVYHEAALGSVPQSVEKPLVYHEVNATGTLRVLDAARQAGVRRVVYAASSSVYGDGAELPKVETMKPDPRSPYATAKLAGEHWLATWAHCYGISTCSLRYFNIFGARQRPDSQYAAVIPAFAKALLEGRRPKIYGDGLQSRDFTHVSNVVWANLLAGASERELKGEAMNIACGRRYTVLDLLNAMADALGVPAEYEACPVRTGEVKHSMASIEAARSVLGYEPIVEFHEGLRETVEWFRQSLVGRSA